MPGCAARHELAPSEGQLQGGSDADTTVAADVTVDKSGLIPSPADTIAGETGQQRAVSAPGDSASAVITDTSVVLYGVEADSLVQDSLEADSTAVDTLAEQRRESEIDTSISYSADEISFNLPTRSSVLTGHAQVVYTDMTLKAHKIVVDWDRNIMTATPTTDTTWTDSTQTEIDTISIIGEPTFLQGNQRMTGSLMRVNMKTREGYIVDGRTQYGEGYYYGEDIQKVSDEVFYVRDGFFTSCENEEPHYCFTGDFMKMVYKQQVVGKPIVMRFGDVPVFALPFGVFSIKPGRHSGLITPTFGEDSHRGHHLQNLGYYWAASDYWDTKMLLNYYERLGLMIRSDLAYRIRYKLYGGISGSWVDQSVAGGRGGQRRWDLRVMHNQDIDPTMKLRVDGTFISDGSYYSDISTSAEQRLNQKIRSNATLTKSWPGTRSSASMNLRHEQNLVTNENSQTLPSISFRLGSAPLFPSREARKRQDKDLLYEPPQPRSEAGEEGEESEEKWYNNITIGYGNRLENRREENLIDSQGRRTTDPALGTLDEKYSSGIQHSVSMNAPQKVARYFNLTPSIRYREDWFNERRIWHATTDTIAIDDSLTFRSRFFDIQERGFFQRRTFSTSLTGNTKLFGYFNLNMGSVKTIRHVLTPSLSFTYRPDFSVLDWGYYQEVISTLGDTLFDRYQGSIFGATSRGKQLNLGMSISNLFQMKRVKIDEQGEEIESKSDLFTYNMGTSYNFAADSLNFSPLSSSFRASPISAKNKIGILQRLSIDISTIHSFYQFEQGVRLVDKFYWDQPGRGFNLNFLRMTSFSTTSAFTLSGKSPFVRTIKAEVEEDAKPDKLDLETSAEQEIQDELGNRFDPAIERAGAGTSTVTPWNFTGQLRYNLSMSDPMNPRETIKLSGTINIQLTRKWKFTYSTGVDLVTRQVVTSNLLVTRDLHCWEATFSWSPMGIGQGFFLHIGIKTPMLRDIKLEQRRGRGSIGMPRY